MVLPAYVHISTAFQLLPCIERCRALHKLPCRDGRMGGSFGKALDRQMFQDPGGKAPSGCAGMTELSCLGVPCIQGIFGNSDVYICGPAHTAPSDKPCCTRISCAPHRMGGTYGCRHGHTPSETGRADRNHPQGHL